MGWSLLRGGVQSVLVPPEGPARLQLVQAELVFLEHVLKEKNAAQDMQRIFPEGATFILTLYGLTWANLEEQSDDASLKEHAQTELRWTLTEQMKGYALAPFGPTQVRNGVFWLGQRNIILARYCELAKSGELKPELVKEFHENSSALAAAFQASPTHHLESYPSMCWPADNVTALASLLIHDRLYHTTHGMAYRQWKSWTGTNSDPGTKLPAGRINAYTGALDEPARGCANSWNIALLMRDDPDFARELYQKYCAHFLIKHLGLTMFREYPVGSTLRGDVDSGPVIWGAGVTASGVGVAAAHSVGDAKTYTDLHGLSGTFGWPHWTSVKGRTAHDYLFGLLPMGDAFLAWSYSTPPPKQVINPAPATIKRIFSRAPLFLCIAALLALLALAEYLAVRRIVRLRRTDNGT